MKRMTVAVVVVALCGCSLTPEPTEITKEAAQDIVESFQYIRARNGLCFAVTAVQKITARADVSDSVVVVPVDCGKVR